jgi:predicted TIM-barrel fold metal-dependent hydrolase
MNEDTCDGLSGSCVCSEPILDPDLPIIDAHHHLWIRKEEAVKAALEQTPDGDPFRVQAERSQMTRYLLDEFAADLNSGHRVEATVFVDSRSMYRITGPDILRSVGEIEFANGIAAMSASGNFGNTRICAAIIGDVDLSLGDAAEEVLHAHLEVAGHRYRGVHWNSNWDPNPSIPSWAPCGLLQDEKFRAGFKLLQGLSLCFEPLIWEPQIPELIDLARDFPETQIILNHLGMPLGIGAYAGRRAERFPIWRENIRTLAKCGNVALKLGALGAGYAGFASFGSMTPASSAELAGDWRPYIESCIEAFGAERCMFESNFPVDAATCSYPVLWNAFKRLSEGASKDEKSALFSGTAARLYRINLESAV